MNFMNVMNIYDFQFCICQSTFPCICVHTLVHLPAFSGKCSSVPEKNTMLVR